MKQFILVILIILGFLQINAQDIQHSMFYTIPTFINPAFAGSEQATRVSLNHRRQWNHIDKGYQTSFFSLDHNFEKLKLGAGLYFVNDRQGIPPFVTNEGGIQISYGFNITSNLRCRLGIQTTLFQRRVDITNLTFPSQFDNSGNLIVPNNNESIPLDEMLTYDFSFGSLIYDENFWLSFSLNHFTQPENSFYKNIKQTSVLPMKINVFGGYKIDVTNNGNGEQYLSFIANYKHQSRFDQFDIGCIYNINPEKTGLFIGSFYRGIPYIKNYKRNLINQDAVILYTGISLSKAGLFFGYSFDYSISKLQNKSGNSHEISLIWIFNNKYDDHERPWGFPIENKSKSCPSSDW